MNVNYKSHKQAKARNRNKAETRKDLVNAKCDGRNKRIHAEPMRASALVATFNLIAAQTDLANSLPGTEVVPSYRQLIGFANLDGEILDIDTLGEINWRDCNPNNPDRTLLPIFAESEVTE